jgi:chromosome segregation ATPase
VVVTAMSASNAPEFLTIASPLGALRYALLAVFGFALAVASPADAIADNNKNKGKNSNDVKRADREADAARDKAQAERKQAEEARNQYRKAAAALERQIDQTGDVRKKVEQELDNAPPLANARRQRELAQTDWEDARRPILEKLAAQADYTAAQRRVETAKARIAGAGGEERAELAQEFAAATAAVRTLESKTLDADTTARTAKDRFAASEERVRELVAKRREAVERDPRLVAAIRELDQAKQEAAKARAKAEAEARQLAEAERKAMLEERQKQDLLRKQRDQQNNKNKSKNNKGKR